MEPTSPVVVLLLLCASIGLLLAMLRWRHWAVRTVSGGGVLLLAMVSGIAAVNDYYGYYQSWGTLGSDLFGSGPRLGGNIASFRSGSTVVEAGSVARVDLPGRHSGINRSGLVYLPPQYDNQRYAHVRFPVVELFHGSPGGPLDWVSILRVERVVDTLIARRLMGPVVLVMPTINQGHRYQDCVNGPTAADETYLAQDVPADIRSAYRVSDDSGEWGLAGYSSGGYCAANIALRHRADFGAAAVLDGYFRAQDGPAGQALDSAPAAEAANSPIDQASALASSSSPLPAFWVSAGTGDAGDFRSARAFVRTLDRVEQVPFVVEPKAGHDFYAWSAALPQALAWTWQQIAPPDLRDLFPVVGAASSIRIEIPPAQRAHKEHPVRPAPAVTATVTVTVTAPAPATAHSSPGSRPSQRPSPVPTPSPARPTPAPSTRRT